MTTTQEELTRILRELQGVKCFCGAKKAANVSFCRSHLIILPRAIRDALHGTLFGHGYEQAYADARQFFDEQKEGQK